MHDPSLLFLKSRPAVDPSPEPNENHTFYDNEIRSRPANQTLQMTQHPGCPTLARNLR